MAELLLMAKNVTHPDPVENARACYKRWDIIRVEETGYQWSPKELIPPINGGGAARVVITDVTKQQVINWVRNHWSCEVAANDVVDGVMVRRRRVRIDGDLVPNSVKNQLNTNGVYTTTWTQIRQYVRNKLTNETASGAITA